MNSVTVRGLPSVQLLGHNLGNARYSDAFVLRHHMSWRNLTYHLPEKCQAIRMFIEGRVKIAAYGNYFSQSV